MHTERILEANKDDSLMAKRERVGLEGYCNYKVWRSDIPPRVAYAITAKTSQEACEIYLDQNKPTEECKVSVQNSLLPGGCVTFTVKCVPTTTYSLSLEG